MNLRYNKYSELFWLEVSGGLVPFIWQVSGTHDPAYQRAKASHTLLTKCRGEIHFCSQMKKLHFSHVKNTHFKKIPQNDHYCTMFYSKFSKLSTCDVFLKGWTLATLEKYPFCSSFQVDEWPGTTMGTNQPLHLPQFELLKSIIFCITF